MSKIGDRLIDFGKLKPKQFIDLPDEAFRAAGQEILRIQQEDRRENQILYYRSASEGCAAIHKSTAKVVGAGGGNGSSKTETCLVELIALATGVLPNSIRDDLRPKFRGAINTRVVLESLTTVLHQIILPKLKWWVWTGLKPQAGDQGHWGWVPKSCLKDGSWERSWSEKLRTLTVTCRDPDDPDKVLGESKIQFMSVDQDASDFASGDFEIVMHDEPPTLAIWTENEARTMRVDGRMFLAMTWPDDPSIPVDWIFDKIYEKGLEGPNKSLNVDWFELDTRDNPFVSQPAVAKQMAEWTHEQREVRIKGQPIRFANRIHPLFTDHDLWWCFSCGRVISPVGDRRCDCGSEDICEFNHVRDFEGARNWPTVFVLDPHPRKPHMFLWAQIDPSDDIWIVADGELAGEPVDLRIHCDELEESMGLNVAVRLIDPNMGRSPTGVRRDLTWQDEFDAAQLFCDLADDSDVGRGRFNDVLVPDPHRLQPRIHFHPRCHRSVHQIKRYVWDDHRRKDDRDLKQKPRAKNDDYPTMIKYLLNFDPSFRFLHSGPQVLKRPGTRRGAY